MRIESVYILRLYALRDDFMEETIENFKVTENLLDEIEEELDMNLRENDSSIDLNELVEVMCGKIHSDIDHIQQHFDGDMSHEYLKKCAKAKILALSKVSSWLNPLVEYIDETPEDVSFYDFPHMKIIEIKVSNDKV